MSQPRPTRHSHGMSLRHRTVSEYYDQNPESAVDAGLHQYDGQMSDLSATGLQADGDWLDGVVTAARHTPTLTRPAAFERDYLLAAMRSRLFDCVTRNSRARTRISTCSFDVSVYVDREYAPLAERLQAYTKYMAQVPGRMRVMRRTSSRRCRRRCLILPIAFRRVLRTTSRQPFPSCLRPSRTSSCSDSSPRRTRMPSTACDKAGAWLDGLKATATDDFALGEERFLKMLKATEGVDVTLAELKAAGELDLERNLDALARGLRGVRAGREHRGLRTARCKIASRRKARSVAPRASCRHSRSS